MIAAVMDCYRTILTASADAISSSVRSGRKVKASIIAKVITVQATLHITRTKAATDIFQVSFELNTIRKRAFH